MKKILIVFILIHVTIFSYSSMIESNKNDSEVIWLESFDEESNPFVRTVSPLDVFLYRDLKELVILNQNIEGLKLKISGEDYVDIIYIGKSIINLSGYLPGKHTIEFTDCTGSKHWIGTFEL